MSNMNLANRKNKRKTNKPEAPGVLGAIPAPPYIPNPGTLDEALHSIREDWRLTDYASHLCAVNVLAVISRRQLRNEIAALTKYEHPEYGGAFIRDRRGVRYSLDVEYKVAQLLSLPDDPTIPGTNGEFLISFRELGDTRVAMVKVNPTPDLAPPKVVTI